jgi:hypothetical protein
MTSVKPYGDLLENINKLYPKELASQTEKVILAYQQLLENQNKNRVSTNKSDSSETKNKIIKIMKEKLAERDNDFDQQKNKYEAEINNLRGIIDIERESYTKEISNLQSKINDLDTQIIKMENKMENDDEDNMELDRLKHKLNATEEALKYTCSKLEESDIELSQLLDVKQELDKIKKHNDELVLKLAEQETKHNELILNTTKSYELINNEYETMYKNQKSINDKIESELKVEKENAKQLKTANESLNNELNQATELIKTIEIVNRNEKQNLTNKVAEDLEYACDLKEKLDMKNKEFDKIGYEYKKLEIDYMNLLSVNRELKLEHNNELKKTEEALQRALDGKKELFEKFMNEQNNNWEGQYNALESDYNDLIKKHKDDMDSINKRYSLLKQTYESQTDIISQLRNENHRIEELYKETLLINNNLKESVNDLERIIDRKDTEYTRLLDNKEKLLNDCIHIKTYNHDLISEKQNLNKTIDELNHLNENNITKISELQALNETQYQECEFLQCENKTYIQHESEMNTLINDLKSQLGFYKDIDEKYQAEKDAYAKLKNMYDFMNTKVLELGKKYAENTTEYVETRNKYEAVIIENSKMTLNISKLTDNYNLLKLQSENEISKKTQALDELSSKFKEVSDELAKLKENYEKINMNYDGWDFVEHETN